MLLPAQRALCVHEHRVQACARRHEQTVAMAAAETKVGAAFRQMNMADGGTLRIDDSHAVQPLAHAPAAPEIAVDIEPEPIRTLTLDAGDEDASVTQTDIVRGDIVNPDDARKNPGFGDIELPFVRREGEAVRAVDIIGRNADRPALTVDAEQIGRQFRGCRFALVIAANAEARGR